MKWGRVWVLAWGCEMPMPSVVSELLFPLPVEGAFRQLSSCLGEVAICGHLDVCDSISACSLPLYR